MKMSKAEKMFWTGLFLAAGMILGALMVTFSQTSKPIDCDNGISEQVENGVRKKTYIPSLDTCKGQK